MVEAVSEQSLVPERESRSNPVEFGAAAGAVAASQVELILSIFFDKFITGPLVLVLVLVLAVHQPSRPQACMHSLGPARTARVGAVRERTASYLVWNAEKKGRNGMR